MRIQKVPFVHQQDDAAAAFVFLGRQQILGLADQLGLEATGHRAQGAHDGDVQAADADGRIGQVHNVMRCLIELTDRGAHCDGLANANLTGDDAQHRFGDTEADAGHRLLVTGSFQEVFCRDGLGERCTGETEMADPGCACHAERSSSGWASVSWWSSSAWSSSRCWLLSTGWSSI